MDLPEMPSDQLSPDLVDELDKVILEFEDLQSELTYDQAKGALQSILERLQLTPREAAGLEQEVHSLTQLMQKLEQAVVQIAVFGLVGRGKSSLLNALAGEAVFATGPTHGVTQAIQSTEWQVNQESLSDRTTIQRATLQGVDQSRIELIDTPGLDEVAGAERERLAREVAATADLILFVIAGDITRVEFEALSQLRIASKPILLVFNKIDQYPTVDQQVIYRALVDERLRELISPAEIVMASAAPLVAVAQPQADGRLRPSLQRGAPDVAALKLKILDILQQEGLALIALNTLLYADDLNEAIVQKKLAIREQTANEIIWRSVMTKAIAVALNPVTVLDVLTGAIVDIAMIISLSRLYGLPMTQAGAVKLLRNIALELGGLSASELLVTLGLSSLKGLLGLGAPATGGLSLAPYTSVAITQAAVVGVATYGIGLVTKQYLANGATWGPEGPKPVVTRILENLDETSILNRIKSELAQKLESVPKE
ncbi:MAG: GTP-binding protein [Cyanobacteria bacterium P01_F01_bin.56]